MEAYILNPRVTPVTTLVSVYSRISPTTVSPKSVLLFLVNHCSSCRCVAEVCDCRYFWQVSAFGLRRVLGHQHCRRRTTGRRRRAHRSRAQPTFAEVHRRRKFVFFFESHSATTQFCSVYKRRRNCVKCTQFRRSRD